MTPAMASFTDVYSSALRGEDCHVVGAGEPPRPLPVASWIRQKDGDDALLDQCVGSCVDLGCGPGRMSESLAARGHVVLGVDLVQEAVQQTRGRGVAALRRDVFDPLPGEGRWNTALLADGNIGIGGDPAALLSRVADLLVVGGRTVVDLAAPGTGVEVRSPCLETSSRRSRTFAWAVVGVDAVAALAASAGLGAPRVHRHGDRWFAVVPKVA